MLRRKLLIVFGSLIALLVVLAATAVWMLQGALADLHHINTNAMAVADDVNRLNDSLTAVELDLSQIQLGQKRHLDNLILEVESAGLLIGRVGGYYVVHLPENEKEFRSLAQAFPEFERDISSLATAQDPELARKYTVASLNQAMTLRQGVRRIDLNVRRHAREEHRDLAQRFRWLIFGIAIGCLLVINLAIVALLKAAGMVLRPVDKLVETSRRLTSEHFDHRPAFKEADEFDELADAYDQLAERIQSSEKRRMEMLSQVALTLNHELNNSIAIIELQLQLLGRQSGGNGRFETSLKHIKENLHRMAQTVESLKHIRRIVLTDYISGIKMLDLRRSVLPDGADADATESGSDGAVEDESSSAPAAEEA